MSVPVFGFATRVVMTQTFSSKCPYVLAEWGGAMLDAFDGTLTDDKPGGCSRHDCVGSARRTPTAQRTGGGQHSVSAFRELVGGMMGAERAEARARVPQADSANRRRGRSRDRCRGLSRGRRGH